MGTALGNALLRGIRYGEHPITQVRRGSQLIYSASALRDDFNRDELGALWVPVGSTASPYLATIVNGSCRLHIPEGLISESLRTARHRFVGATAESDNGILKVRIGSRGDNNANLHTQIFAWMPNDDSGSHGVGIELRASTLYITRRVAGVDQQMRMCGSYLPGEDIWLATNERNYSMYREGNFVGAWQDDGASAAKGPGFRSVGVVVRGLKDFLGPRRFSPAIDYIEQS